MKSPFVVRSATLAVVFLAWGAFIGIPQHAHAQGSEIVKSVIQRLARGTEEASKLGRGAEDLSRLCGATRLTEIGKLGTTVEQAVEISGRTGTQLTKVATTTEGLSGLTEAIEAEAKLAAGTRAGRPVVGPTTGIFRISPEEAFKLAEQGYVPRGSLFSDEFAEAFRQEVDRLIDKGLINPAKDRVLNGEPTEWIINLGVVWGNGPGSKIMQESPLFKQMFEELQEFGRSYNAIREQMIASGKVTAEEAPAIAVDGAEMNINLVIGLPGHQWSGLHLHRDMLRFNDSLTALNEESIRHAAVTSRAFTFSGYSRPIAEDGTRMNDMGGALPFMLRQSTRNAGDRAIFDIVPAHHNTGAFFFPHTTHGVARMPEIGPTGGPSIRYSFQVFFPELEAWEKALVPRIESGELARELEDAAKATGQTGWR